MSLTECMMKYKSDKGGDERTNHNYTTVYDPLLSHLKSSSDVNIFELGLGTINPERVSNMGWIPGYRPGASHRAWADWLPNAKIFGADIDRDCLFDEERIKTFYVDQTSHESIKELWAQIPEQFDVMIDDGIHEFPGSHIFLMNSYHKLKPNGIYIIEDIADKDLMMYRVRIPDYELIFQSVELVRLFHPRNEGDNNILLCRAPGPQ